MNPCRVLGSEGLDDRQENIYDWIKNTHRLPTYADIYKISVLLFNCKEPGYVTFVAHAGRDIVNGLAFAITGEIRPPRIEYHERLDKIEEKWDDRWGASQLGTDPPPHHEIPHKICRKLKSLLDENRGSQARADERDFLSLRTFLHYEDKDSIPEKFIQEWKAARKWFQRHAHARKGEITLEAEEALVKHFQTLETYLYISASSQHKRIGELDEILEETN